MDLLHLKIKGSDSTKHIICEGRQARSDAINVHVGEYAITEEIVPHRLRIEKCDQDPAHCLFDWHLKFIYVVYGRLFEYRCENFMDAGDAIERQNELLDIYEQEPYR